MFSAVSRDSGHLGNKVKTFLNSPGNAEFDYVLISNPSFNICQSKVKTVKSMICRFTFIENEYIWVILLNKKLQSGGRPNF